MITNYPSLVFYFYYLQWQRFKSLRALDNLIDIQECILKTCPVSTVQRHDNKGSHLHKWCHWSKGARLRSEQVPSLSIGNQHREVVDHVWQADNRTLGNSFNFGVCCMDSTFIRHEPNYWCRLSVQHFAKQGKKGVETARSYAFQCCTQCHIPMCVL